MKHKQGPLLVASGGLLLHVILLLSIFDIYFRSPLVQHVPPQDPRHHALARRLVLFSVDGLRAQSFFEHRYTPFLRFVAEKQGIWGKSYTQVPTESRPGHVALIAGFYEDPSAVTKGWKKNPVDFDSVFNQSRYSWCWGADDIINIFTNADNDSHIFTATYDTEDQSFNSDRNTTLLDAWVFNKVAEFFGEAKKNESLMSKLQMDKILIFLHLLGMDTAGHTHKPDHPDFITNLQYVDEGISRIENLVEDFYNSDGQTTYIMTSDHGMTNWGSHGAGSQHETETPYIIWGAGIVQQINNGTGYIFGLPSNKRKDITQADIAPLVSTVISIPVPVNSIGKLPADLLNTTIANKAMALYSNGLQLATQYNCLREQVEDHALSLIYYPYAPFTKEKYNEVVKLAEKLLAMGEFEKLIRLSETIMESSLSGLAYYHNYYQHVLLICVSLSFCGWIVLLLTMLMEQERVMSSVAKTRINRLGVRGWLINACFGILLILFGLAILLQQLPLQYYLYTAVPVLLWWRVVSSSSVWLTTFRAVARNKIKFYIFIQVLCYILGTIALVQCFTDRWWLSLPLLGAAVWPTLSPYRQQLTCPLLVCWAASCSLLAVFSFLPVVGKQAHLHFVIAAGIAWIAVTAIFLHRIVWRLYRVRLETKRTILVIFFQSVLLALALHNVYVQSLRFESGQSVSVVHQTLAWVIAVSSLLMPLLGSTRMICRLFSAYSGLLTFYLLLSVTHEGLFLLTLVLNQACWLLIELRLAVAKKKIAEYVFGEKDSDVRNHQGLLTANRSLTAHDFRRAFFFLLYIIMSFFGTGNIASVNSFEVRWVTCFVTNFQPFLITALVLAKTTVPFLVVACCFRAINMIVRAPTLYMMVIVLIFSDMMGVQFLFLVRNTGSWLEIGSSISQYVIAQAITLFVLVLHTIAKVLCEKSVSQLVVRTRKKFV